MNCFTVLGIEPTTEKKTIKRAYAAKSREFHPEEHPEEFQRIHDAYEEALAWAERNAGREEEPQMPEEPRRMEMGAAEQEKAAESETWNYAEPERNPEEAYMENPQKEDVQSEESSAQYEELPVHSDEDSEESFREEEAGEPPVQLEEDFQTWDGDWTRQFQNMADASERQGADDREVRKIMEQCISLYLNEKERNKLYHWKDILEEPAYREYFRTKTFVESWYHFLDTHRMFDAAIWQYFQWIDGKLFSALEADVMPFAYPTQEEIERMPAGDTGTDAGEANTGAWSGTSKGEKGEIQSGEGTLISCGACGNRDRRNDPWNYSRYDIRVRRTEDEKEKIRKKNFCNRSSCCDWNWRFLLWI